MKMPFVTSSLALYAFIAVTTEMRKNGIPITISETPKIFRTQSGKKPAICEIR